MDQYFISFWNNYGPLYGLGVIPMLLFIRLSYKKVVYINILLSINF